MLLNPDINGVSSSLLGRCCRNFNGLKTPVHGWGASRRWQAIPWEICRCLYRRRQWPSTLFIFCCLIMSLRRLYEYPEHITLGILSTCMYNSHRHHHHPQHNTLILTIILNSQLCRCTVDGTVIKQIKRAGDSNNNSAFYIYLYFAKKAAHT